MLSDVNDAFSAPHRSLRSDRGLTVEQWLVRVRVSERAFGLCAIDNHRGPRFVNPKQEASDGLSPARSAGDSERATAKGRWGPSDARMDVHKTIAFANATSPGHHANQERNTWPHSTRLLMQRSRRSLRKNTKHLSGNLVHPSRGLRGCLPLCCPNNHSPDVNGQEESCRSLR